MHHANSNMQSDYISMGRSHSNNNQVDYGEVRDRARSNISLGSAGELYQDYVHE